MTIPITLPKTKLAALVEHPVLLPSEIIAWMLCNGKFSLKEIVNMQEAQPVRHNRLQDKCKQFHLPETSTIPMGLHGDGVPFSKIHSQALHNCGSQLELAVLDQEQKSVVLLSAQGHVLQVWVQWQTHIGCIVGSAGLGPQHALG